MCYYLIANDCKKHASYMIRQCVTGFGEAPNDGFGRRNALRIMVLGAGAMGMLFGGYLSEQNEVWLLDVDSSRVDKINADGVLIREPDGDRTFRPKAVTSAAGLRTMDLVIVFVKAMYTVDALFCNRSLIGEDTYLMTLQNGAGHEAKLLSLIAVFGQAYSIIQPRSRRRFSLKRTSGSSTSNLWSRARSASASVRAPRLRRRPLMTPTTT